MQLSDLHKISQSGPASAKARVRGVNKMEAGQNLSKHRRLALATSLSILRVAEIACRYRRLQSGLSPLHDTICQSLSVRLRQEDSAKCYPG